MRIDILLLGVPRRYSGELRDRARAVDAPSVVSETSRNHEHLTFRVVERIVPVARLFDCVFAEIQRWPSARARNTLCRMRYRPDPSCIVPRCDRLSCETLCGADLWRTPQYWDDNPGDERDGDCDDIELLVGGMRGGGLPLFVRPHGADQGHVMHLPYRRADNALDYCIPAGMKRWRGPRNCFFFDHGNIVEGTIQHDNQSPATVFRCHWS